MIVNGTITGFNNQPLPGASVEVIDVYGQKVGSTVVANNSGMFSVDSAALDYGALLRFTHVGYKPATYQPLKNETIRVILERDPTSEELPGVTVTPGNNRKGLGWIIAAIAAIVILK